MAMDEQPRQNVRLIFLLFEVLILIIASRLAFHTWYPPIGEKGFWFYAALLSLLLGYRLTSPYYTSPTDALANAFPAVVTLLLVNQWKTWSHEDRAAFAVAVIYGALITVAALISIVFKDGSKRIVVNISNALRILVEDLGSPRIVYGIVFAFSLYVFHRNSSLELLVVGGAGLLTIVISPFNYIYIVNERIFSQWRRVSFPTNIAQSLAYQGPGIYLLREHDAYVIKRNDILLVKDQYLPPVFTIALDHIGRDGGAVLRAIEVPQSAKTRIVEELAKSVPSGGVRKIDVAEIQEKDLRRDVQILTSRMVGIVSPDSTITKIYFEVIGDQIIEEGRLVETKINNTPVLYQIVNGITKEDIISQKNMFGYIRAEARKIGLWNADEKRFVNAPWLPTINTPVELKQSEVFDVTPECVGCFPGSSYGVKISDIHQMVTHNTAILGILGVGKTFLAVELIERMMAEGIKIICLDMTHQYADLLHDFYCKDKEAESIAAIVAACDEDRNIFHDNPDDGGSLPNLTQAILEDLRMFLDPKNPTLLKIYNPAELTATKQTDTPRSYMEGGQWKRSAALWNITAVEVTRIVSESALLLLQDRLSDTARACLVYEEAHSLVPEWNNVTQDGDRAAVSGSARAILQGRKYGLGCLLITQRTANVTKTILNQCNTIFAMRTFDDTGKDFLANYLGSDYSNMLPVLRERQAVLFGRASSAENPVLIRLNDREKFLDAFRRTHPTPDLEKLCSNESYVKDVRVATLAAQGTDFDDDITF